VSVSSSLSSGGPWLAKIQGMHKVEGGNMVGGDGGHILTRWGWSQVQTAE